MAAREQEALTAANTLSRAREQTAAVVRAAALLANAHDFIMDQPESYDTQVGQGGGATREL